MRKKSIYRFGYRELQRLRTSRGLSVQELSNAVDIDIERCRQAEASSDSTQYLSREESVRVVTYLAEISSLELSYISYKAILINRDNMDSLILKSISSMEDYIVLKAVADEVTQLLQSVLTDKQKKILELIYYQGYLQKEVAGMLGVSKVMISKQVSIIEKRMKLVIELYNAEVSRDKIVKEVKRITGKGKRSKKLVSSR